jgi:predicted Zn-dependent protease
MLLPILQCCTTAPYTGRRQLMIMTASEETQLGLQAYKEVLAESRLSSNSSLTEMVRRCGNRIAAVAERPDFEWEFNVIADPQANAFALPGGKVAFYEGILPICKDETGVAVVMGHEVAHAIARHGGERISTAMVTQFGVETAAAMLGGDDPQTQEIVRAGLGIGAHVGVTLRYSREHESEADYIGLMLMAKAGYDPRVAPGFWKRMAAQSPGSAGFEWLSTHPHHDTRVEQLEGWLPEAIKHYEASQKNRP